MPAFPDINGTKTSYCSVELGIDGTRIKGVKSLNYRESHDIGMIRGLSSHPIGRTRGMVSFEGDIELYQADWLTLLPILTVAGKFGFAELAHTIFSTYAEVVASPTETVQDILEGVRFHSPESGVASDSGDAQVVKLSMSIMNIRWGRGVFQGLRHRP